MMLELQSSVNYYTLMLSLVILLFVFIFRGWIITILMVIICWVYKERITIL